MNKLIIVLITAFLSLLSIYSRAEPQTIMVAKSNGSKQCEPGHIGLAAMQTELTGNGVPVVAAHCGSDGMAHIAECGTATGQLNIYEIPVSELPKAKAIGFQPLAEWPEATPVDCPKEPGTEAPTQGAVELRIESNRPAVTTPLYGKVRQAIGNAIANGTVDNFSVHEHGLNGAFSACAEKGYATGQKRFEAFVKRLRAIPVRPKTAAYSVQSTTHCT